MQLTDIQKDKVRQWAAEGASLSRIQDLLAEEFNIRMSFIDVRFLVLDLEVSIKEKEAPKPPPPASPGVPPSRVPSPESPSPEFEEIDKIEEIDKADDFDTPTPDSPASPSKLTVSLSRIAQPGFAVCGDVTFSDGVSAQWGITARGELALVGPPADYRPSPEDAREFQTQLRNLLS